MSMFAVLMFIGGICFGTVLMGMVALRQIGLEGLLEMVLDKDVEIKDKKDSEQLAKEELVKARVQQSTAKKETVEDGTGRSLIKDANGWLRVDKYHIGIPEEYIGLDEEQQILKKKHADNLSPDTLIKLVYGLAQHYSENTSEARFKIMGKWSQRILNRYRNGEDELELLVEDMNFPDYI